MKCEDCHSFAWLVCKCNALKCEKHAFEHLKKTDNEQHDIKTLFKSISSEEKVFLKSKLKKWIFSLEKLKNQVLSQTNELITKIEDSSSLLIKKIHQAIQKYRKIIDITEQLFKTDEITQILEFDIAFKELNLSNLYSGMNTVYSDCLYSLENFKEADGRCPTCSIPWRIQSNCKVKRCNSYICKGQNNFCLLCYNKLDKNQYHGYHFTRKGVFGDSCNTLDKISEKKV